MKIFEPAPPTSLHPDWTDAPAIVGGAAVLVVTATSALGLAPVTLVDGLVLLGVAVVLPLAIPQRWWWTAASAGVLVSLHVSTGWPAALFALPWMIVAFDALALQLLRPWPDTTCLPSVSSAAARGYAVIGAAAFVCSRLGAAPFSIQEPIVELTAVHFTFAGVGALVLATRFLERPPGPRATTARVATTLIVTAPIVVATGFLTHRSLPQVGGAVLLTAGVWLTAALELRATLDRRRTVVSRALLLVSGAAIWIPMVLAVSWAGGQHWDVPALSIDAMVRTHGIVNALAFVIAGLLATGVGSPDG